MDQTENGIKKFPFKVLGSTNAGGGPVVSAGFNPLPYKAQPSVASNQASPAGDVKTAAPVAEKAKVFEAPVEQPKLPIFSEKDLLDSRQKGYEDGYAKGYAGAKSDEAETEKKIQASLEDITLKLAAISEAVKTRNDAHIKELVDLSLKLARKVAGTALKKDPYEEIENVVRNSLPLLFDEPLISVSVNVDLLEKTKGRIMELAKNEGFKNNIEISGNQALTPGSCDIQWNGGGIKAHKDVIWEEIEELCGCL